MTQNDTDRTFSMVAMLDDERRALLRRIVDQLLVCNDPDIVESFVAWRTDPRVESLLQLAAKLDDERLDQLLFAAEDLFSESRQRYPPVRA